jgi:hypothetical protein
METVAAFHPCVMTLPLSDDRAGHFGLAAAAELADPLGGCSAVGCGPGMGTGLGAIRIVERLLADPHRAVLLDAEGYLADTDGSSPQCFHINLHSCPIWDVATQFGQACTSELEFIRDLIPEARVERVTHKARGAHTCTYEIHP